MSWSEAITALESSVAAVERALDQGCWSDLAGCWSPPSPEPQPPTAEELGRLREIQERCEDATARLMAAMAGVAGELAALNRRRLGARGYLQSQGLAAPRLHLVR